MTESKAHKRYMQKYRKQKAKEAAESETPQGEWRTRRHATTRPDGEPATSHLFDLRQQLVRREEKGPLTDEDREKKDGIEHTLRRRRELSPKAGSGKTDHKAFYTKLYTRLGLTSYLPAVLGELNASSPRS